MLKRPEMKNAILWDMVPCVFIINQQSLGRYSSLVVLKPQSIDLCVHFSSNCFVKGTVLADSVVFWYNIVRFREIKMSNIFVHL